MPAVERNLLNRFLIDDLADGDGGCLDRLCIRRHIYFLRQVADLKLEILYDDLTDFECHGVNHLRTESLGLRFNPIYSRWQRGDLIVPVTIGLRLAFKRRGLIPRF